MIAIKSNKELYFPDGKGKVTMRIDMIINRPDAQAYEMRLIDTCTKEVTEDEVTKVLKIGTPKTRFKTMTYEELDTLVANLNIENITKETLREDINEIFRQGLLVVTQMECMNGISGEPGKGQYYSEAQDWEILREETVEKAEGEETSVEKQD
jgi:hypothetical protein